MVGEIRRFGRHGVVRCRNKETLHGSRGNRLWYTSDLLYMVLSEDHAERFASKGMAMTPSAQADGLHQSPPDNYQISRLDHPCGRNTSLHPDDSQRTL